MNRFVVKVFEGSIKTRNQLLVTPGLAEIEASLTEGA